MIKRPALQIIKKNCSYTDKRLLRPIYTEELPGVAAHDFLFVLLRPEVAAQSRARAQNYPTQQNKQRIMRGYSWQLLSV